MAVYDNELSQVTAAALADFIRRDDLATCDIETMPGIGPATAEALSDYGINRVGQIVGHLL